MTQWCIQGKKYWGWKKIVRGEIKKCDLVCVADPDEHCTPPNCMLIFFSVCTKFSSILKVCISIYHCIALHPCFWWNCSYTFFSFAGSLEHLRGLSTDTFSSWYTMPVIYRMYSYITCIYIFLNGAHYGFLSG